MNICFIETQEQIDKLGEDILRESLLIAMTPWAMYGLDMLNLRYKIITDYYGIESLDRWNYEIADGVSSFCRSMDKIIKGNLNDDIFKGSRFEPCFWMTKYIMALFFPTICYINIIKKIIEDEKPARIYYFTPINWSLEGEGIIFSNSNFSAHHLKSIKGAYPKIEWTSFSAGNESMFTSTAIFKGHAKLRKWLVDILPNALKSASLPLVKRQILPKLRLINRKTKGIMILRMLDEITEIIRNSYGKKQIWIWANNDKAGSNPVYYSVIPQSIVLKIKYSLANILFSKKDFRKTVKETFSKEYQCIIEPLLKKYMMIHQEILKSVKSYLRAYRFFDTYAIEAVLSQNAAEHMNNAVLAAASERKVKTFIMQHGGTYGQGYRWQPKLQDYYFPDYFAFWGKGSKELAERYEKHNCSFFYMGRLKRNPQPKAKKGNVKKRVLFVPNNSYKGYILSGYSDCWIYDLEKKVIDIFKRHTEYEYILKPTPKHKIRDVLKDYWLDNLPGAKVIENMELSDACSIADLVIQDHLGTTLLDAFRAKSRVIGLRRKSFSIYYPEVEKQLRRSCVFCQNEEEFLKMIEKYLLNFALLPDFNCEIERFNELYCGYESGKTIYKNFEEVLTKDDN